MKKIFFIMGLVVAMITAGAPSAEAQQTAVDSMTSVYGKTTDTVTNTATKYMYSGQIRGYQAVISVTAVATAISGTPTGTMTVEASMVGGTSDGDWYPVTSYGVTDSTRGTWTIAVSGVTTKKSFHWKITEWENLYLRVKWTGANTMSAKLNATWLARREILSTLYQ